MIEFTDSIKNALIDAENEMTKTNISVSKRTISNVLDSHDVDKLIDYFKHNKEIKDKTSDEFISGANFILLHIKDYLKVSDEL